MARDWRQDGTPKVLDLGALVLFGALAVFAASGLDHLSIPVVRLVVDVGLVVIAAISLLIGRPFTLGYTPGQTPADPRARAIYLRTHAIITAVWMAAFAVLAVADALMQWVPAIPLWADIGVMVVAFWSAIRFTGTYPERVRARFAPPSQPEHQLEVLNGGA